MNEPSPHGKSPEGRQGGAIVFILITLFIDILGIGIVIPILPELVKQFVGGSTAEAGRFVGAVEPVVVGFGYPIQPVANTLVLEPGGSNPGHCHG